MHDGVPSLKYPNAEESCTCSCRAVTRVSHLLWHPDGNGRCGCSWLLTDPSCLFPCRFAVRATSEESAFYAGKKHEKLCHLIRSPMMPCAAGYDSSSCNAHSIAHMVHYHSMIFSLLPA